MARLPFVFKVVTLFAGVVWQLCSATASELRFEQATIRNKNLVEGGRVFEFSGKGEPDKHAVAITSWKTCSGQNALIYKIQPTAATSDFTGTDKAMHWVTTNPQDFFRFGETRYVAFSIVLPSEFFADNQDVRRAPIVWQVWQGSPFGPPVYARLHTRRGEAKGALHFFVKNDRSTPYPSAASLSLGSIEIIKDRCERIVVMIEPRHYDETRSETAPTGRVKVWKIDAATRHAEPQIDWKGYIGYHPENPHQFYVGKGNSAIKPNEALKISIGLYRVRQFLRHWVVFDDVVYGRDWDSVLE